MSHKSQVTSHKHKNRHCEPRSGEAIYFFWIASSCFAALAVLAMTYLLPCHFSFAKELQEPLKEQNSAEQQTIAKAPKLQETVNPAEALPANAFVWLEDNLPEGATTSNEWIWIKDTKFSGESSHTDGIKQGLHSHSLKMADPIKLEETSVIEQYVYLDPDNPPKGIMLKLTSASGKATDLYWEGEEEVFADTTEYIEAWYMGPLPQTGAWQKLVINLRELEITSLELTGISFITYDGRTYWDSTVILNNEIE